MRYIHDLLTYLSAMHTVLVILKFILISIANAKRVLILRGSPSAVCAARWRHSNNSYWCMKKGSSKLWFSRIPEFQKNSAMIISANWRELNIYVKTFQCTTQCRGVWIEIWTVRIIYRCCNSACSWLECYVRFLWHRAHLRIHCRWMLANKCRFL